MNILIFFSQWRDIFFDTIKAISLFCEKENGKVGIYFDNQSDNERIKNKMFNRFTAIAKKKIKQLRRDTRMLFIIFFFPIVLLIIFGYAINFDVKHIKIAVYDQDKSDYTREYVNGLISSEYFDLVTYIQDESEIKRLLDEKIVQAVIVFPSNLSRKLLSKQEVKVQYLIDGVDGTTARAIQNYVKRSYL